LVVPRCDPLTRIRCRASKICDYVHVFWDSVGCTEMLCYPARFEGGSMKSKFLVNFAICVALLLAASSAFGQSAGRLTGTVVDPSGAAIPNADVSLYLPGGTTPVLKTNTTSEGIFDFIGVRPDRYRLEVETPGFSKHVQADVTVEGARQVTLPEI